MATYDYRCPEGHVFEGRNSIEDRHYHPCECGKMAEKVILSAPILDPKMGVDPDFPTAAAAWDKKQRAKTTGRMKDSNATRMGTSIDVERDAWNARRYYDQ